MSLRVQRLPINPTRMELLKLRRRIRLAKKGHKLLREKRDALIAEFFNLLLRAQGLREKVEESLKVAYQDLILTEALMGSLNVQRAAMNVPVSVEIEILPRNIMGVIIPSIEVKQTERTLLERGYNPIDTTAKLDEATQRFEEALNVIMDLAEVEESIRALAEEVEKVKRRVNALEHIFIPRLENTERYIKLRLDEMARQDFFRLKRIKSLREAG